MDLNKYEIREYRAKITSGELKTYEIADEIIEEIKKYDKNIFAVLLENYKKTESELNKKLSGIIIAVSDNVIIKDVECKAGSVSLEGFIPPYGSEVADRLCEAGAVIIGKTNISEFGIGLSGGICHAAEAINKGYVHAVICPDYNGIAAGAATENGLFYIKPSYGTVSRFGVISTSSSMETIGVMCADVLLGYEILSVISGYDDKDGVMDAAYKLDYTDTREEVSYAVLNDINMNGEKFVFSEIFTHAPAVTYIISSAEISNNISRFDGIKFGHRTKSFKKLNDIYINSRSEGFNAETKLYSMTGAYVLHEEYYNKYFVKAQKIRRIIKNEIDALFEKSDILILPAVKNEVSGYAFSDGYKKSEYSSLAYLTGYPGVFIPACKNKTGNDIQIITKKDRESYLYSALIKILI